MAPTSSGTHSRTRLKRTLVLAAACLALAGSIALWRLSGSGTLDRWQAEAIEARLRSFSHLLPFEIEKVEVRRTWRELLSGRLSRVTLTLKRDEWRVRLSGPLTISKGAAGSGFEIGYQPEASIEPVALGEKGRSDALELEIGVRVAPTLTEITAAGLSTRPKLWRWPQFGLELQKTAITAEWKNAEARLTATIEQLAWKKENEVNLQGLSASLSAPLSLTPFKLGPIIQGSLEARGGEALWREKYFDLPLSKIPLKLELNSGTARARLTVGPPSSRPLEITAEAQTSNGAQKTLSLTWTLPPLSVPGLATTAATIAPEIVPPLLSGIELKEGTLSSKGKLVLEIGAAESAARLRPTSLAGSVRLDRGALRIPKSLFAARGIGLEVAFSRQRGASGSFAVDTILYHRAKARLARTDFSLRPRKGPAAQEWLAREYALAIGDSSELPLQIDGLPLSVASPIGELTLPRGTERLDFTVQTGLTVPPIRARRLLSLLCLPSFSTSRERKPGLTRVPPALVRADFPRVDLGPDWIEPEGKVHAELFGGVAELEGLGVAGLRSATPEIHFDAFVKGVRLDRLGAWLGIGKIDGLLEAEATGVSILSWLPIRYYFRVEAKPRSRDQVIFSPPAMKKFLQLFSPDGAFSRLHWFADAYAFGPLRQLFGGYYLDHAGIILSAADGFIQVRTVEKQGMLKNTAEEGRHFILYGKSNSGFTEIKWPLQGPNYPLIVSAPAISDYVRQLLFRMGVLKPETSDSEKETFDEEPDSGQAACGPPAFVDDRVPDPERQSQPSRGGGPARDG
ncbi:MAG: hypothetical protein NDJ90_07140 [Oligoflexia bacterium]|nr:hypothetical protein [Oligoflexia bacterium]